MVRKLSDLISLSCEWIDLRHDRERAIALYWFDKGFEFGLDASRQDQDHRKRLEQMRALDTCNALMVARST